MTLIRKFTAVAVMGALASFGLAACSSSEGGSAASSNEPVTIEYWHRLPDGEGMIKVQQSADEFTKENPNIKVKTTKFEGKAADSYAKISAAIKAGNAPCLAQVSYNDLPDVLMRGELMDVTEQAAQYKDHYSAGAWAGASLGGKTYGLPQDTGPLVFYYDKDAFDKLGLKVPTTWEEYWETAKKAHEAGKYTSFFPQDDAFDYFGAIVAANGANWYTTEGDAWKVSLNSPESKKVAEAWQKSIDDGTTMFDKRWDENVFDKSIADGKLIGYIGAAWEAAFNLGKLGKDTANWQVAQMPGGKSGPWGGSAVVVLKGCKYPEQALKFADWYNTNMKAMASQGLVPAAKGKAETPENIKKLYGGQDVWGEFAKATESMNPNWLFAPSWQAVKAAFNDSEANKMPLPEAIDKAQQTSVDTLKTAGVKIVE